MESGTISQEHLETATQDANVIEVGVLDILITLSKRRKFILLSTLAAVILTVIVVLVIPSQYTAVTVVMPPGQNSSGSGLLSQLGSSGSLAAVAGASLGVKNYGDMYVSLLRSRTVEDAVIQQFGLMKRYKVEKASDARFAFEGHTKVINGAKDGLITISVTDHDPVKASDIANGYVSSFRKFSANLAITEASQRRVFFQQQLMDAKESLTAAEEALKGTQQSTGLLQIDAQTRSLIESAAVLHAQVRAKEVQLQGMRSYAAEDNPNVIQAKDELNALQTQLAKLGVSDQDLTLIAPQSKVPESGLAYLRKLRDVRYYETISELISRQYELAKLDEARQGTTIQVVDVAVPPDRRSSPLRLLTVLIVTPLAFLLISGWCILVEILKRLKNNPGANQRLNMLLATFRR